jgi:uncharacterized damage-inducible protein DinB
MRTLLCLVPAVLLVLPSALLSQENANPFVNGQKGLYAFVSRNVVAAAEKVPEADYSFKPTPEVRSFGQLVGHVADAQYMFCSMATGEEAPVKGIEKSKTSKADLVQALKDAGNYCTKAYGSLTDAQAAQNVKFFGQEMPKLNILSLNTAHLDEHYGNMVTYMRLKGIVPPTSEQKK